MISAGSIPPPARSVGDSWCWLSEYLHFCNMAKASFSSTLPAWPTRTSTSVLLAHYNKVTLSIEHLYSHLRKSCLGISQMANSHVSGQNTLTKHATLTPSPFHTSAYNAMVNPTGLDGFCQRLSCGFAHARAGAIQGETLQGGAPRGLAPKLLALP